MFWLATILLCIGVVASLWPRQYRRQGHPKFGQHYSSYPVFAVLTGFPALFLITTHLAVVSSLASAVFWSTWVITLIAVVAFARKDGFWGAFVALLAAIMFVLLPFSSDFGHHSAPPASASQNVGSAQVVTNPANPTTTPGSEVTDLPAPGATQDTQTPTSAPTATAPGSSEPGTGSGNTAMGFAAIPLLFGGFVWRRKSQRLMPSR